MLCDEKKNHHGYIVRFGCCLTRVQEKPVFWSLPICGPEYTQESKSFVGAIALAKVSRRVFAVRESVKADAFGSDVWGILSMSTGKLDPCIVKG